MTNRHARDSRSPVFDTFTGRKREAKILSDCLEEHRATLDGSPDVTVSLKVMAAHNILVFHGLGGVGKSSLSRRLQQWLNGETLSSSSWGPPPCPAVAATGRYDLFDSCGNVDPAEVVLAIRATLGAIKPKWPAFDLALATWWAAARPGLPLMTFRDRPNSPLYEPLVSTLADVLCDVGALNVAVGITAGATRTAIRAYMKRRDYRFAAKVVDDQQSYRDLLQQLAISPSRDNPRSDLLIEAIKLLELELRQMGSRPQVVMFLDTFERLQDHNGPDRSGERAVHEIIWNLPSVLFVVTGRNPLNWADRRRLDLTYQGPLRWPGLVDGIREKTRQHLLRSLSKAESRELLRHARDIEKLPFSDDVLEAIVERSHGLPAYLALVLVRIRVGKDEGVGEIAIDVTDDTLEALVEWVLRGIPSDERKVLRAASMFCSFDADLVAAASRQDKGVVLRAFQRPMIESWADPDMPFRMHDAVRHAIRHADPLICRGWAKEDWNEAAGRALEYFCDRIRCASELSRHQVMIRLTAAAIGLVCREDVRATLETPEGGYSDWLVRQVVRGPGISPLLPELPSSSATAYGAAFLSFVRAKSASVSIAECQRTLRELASSDHPISTVALRHLMYSYRSSEEYDRALSVADDLVRIDGCAMHRYHRRLALVHCRRFVDALNEIDAEFGMAPERAEMIRVRVRLHHGDWEPFRLQTIDKVKSLANAGRIREADDLRAAVLFRGSLFAGDGGAEQLYRELESSTASGNKFLERKLRASLVLSDPLGGDAREHLEFIGAVDRSRGRRMSACHAISRCGWAWIREDDAELKVVVAALRRQIHVSAMWIGVEVLLRQLGYDLEASDGQWIDPYEEVSRVWFDVWCRWRNRILSNE